MMRSDRGLDRDAGDASSSQPTRGLSVLRSQKDKSPAGVAGLSPRTGTKNGGSPTWARTRDLRINSTGHTSDYGEQVEDS